jgi:mono/diheme cytochrome c family protein
MYRSYVLTCLILAGLAGTIAALANAACSAPTPTEPASPVPTLAFPTIPPSQTAQFVPPGIASAAQGTRIYRADCVPCHAESGQGNGVQAQFLNPKPPDFTDPALMRRQRPDEYYKAISQGVFGSAMLAWDDTLTREQMWDVLFYVWSLRTTPQEIATGRQIYLTECAACHGQTGDGNGPEATRSPREPTVLSDPSFLAAQTGQQLFGAISRGVEGMPDHTWADRLSEDDRWAVVEYLWTFLYEPANP